MLGSGVFSLPAIALPLLESHVSGADDQRFHLALTRCATRRRVERGFWRSDGRRRRLRGHGPIDIRARLPDLRSARAEMRSGHPAWRPGSPSGFRRAPGRRAPIPHSVCTSGPREPDKATASSPWGGARAAMIRATLAAASSSPAQAARRLSSNVPVDLRGAECQSLIEAAELGLREPRLGMQVRHPCRNLQVGVPVAEHEYLLWLFPKLVQHHG